MDDPQDIIRTAQAFHAAAEAALHLRSHAQRADFSALEAPFAACTAFAVELYLKAILEMEGRRMTEHDLAKLFNACSKRSHDAIVKHVGLPRFAFGDSLTIEKDVFKDWRYLYEGKSSAVNIGFLRQMIVACRATVSAHPDRGSLVV